jgi:hypothetical protein
MEAAMKKNLPTAQAVLGIVPGATSIAAPGNAAMATRISAGTLGGYHG